MTDTIIRHEDLAQEEFPGGATYRMLVGDDDGTTPIRCGIEISPAGYATPNHAHPYVEIVIVLEGAGEAWVDGQDGTTDIGPGITMVFLPNTAHGFRVTGDAPLVTYGVHSSSDRIVDIREK